MEMMLYIFSSPILNYSMAVLETAACIGIIYLTWLEHKKLKRK